MNRKPVLEIKDLRVETTGREPLTILHGINIRVYEGETVALVGESGSGKSMTALSILRLLPEDSVRIHSGEIWFEGRDLLTLSEREMNDIRGRRISMIFQEPMTALNPTYTIGRQLAEVLAMHTDLSAKQIRERCTELLTQVRIPDPKEKLDVYPHQLSGGMRQRVMIAMALACNPKILIADEPTTALDVTIQAQILELLVDLQAKYGMTIILITHDLGVVAETCQRAVVMYAGQIVEESAVDELFASPKHPYTYGLLRSIPKIGESKKRLYTIPGVVPDLRHMPQGCRFHPRCEKMSEKCQMEEPPSAAFGHERRVKCWHPY